jgi:hypothetical protein
VGVAPAKSRPLHSFPSFYGFIAMAGRPRTFSSSSPALAHPVQIKTLLRWANHHLRRSVYKVEHMEELKNGVVLIRLIESAAEVTLECKDPAKSRYNKDQAGSLT